MTRRRPADEPVDESAVLALLDLVEAADPGAALRDRELAVYRRLVGVRHNARAVPVVLADEPDVASADAPEVEPAGTPVVEPAALLGLLRRRRSCRAFAPTPLTDDQLDGVLEAGRWAPSGGNAQPWELLVLQTEASRQLVVDAMVPAAQLLRGLDPTFPGVANPRSLLGAPVHILVLGDIRAMAAYPYPIPASARWAILEQSLAMCIENMWLMATSMGLAATNLTVPGGVDASLRDAFGIPDHFALPTILVLGHPRRAPAPRPRRALDELVHHEHFDAQRVRTDEEIVDACYATGIRGRGFR